eukprot:CAMPEP_0174726524 /NCGR_PEP_ID=MMETSP1094-20130205/47980_1 /TAXON_ID=156173 /ORGANISM="Chrysochromulina brevifilum, Strain UTEX LB 985" /LENGTH=45 /DNA_ID= /DNA_START= /DNA_END= /DNA_ORIENTATION=
MADASPKPSAGERDAIQLRAIGATFRAIGGVGVLRAIAAISGRGH